MQQAVKLETPLTRAADISRRRVSLEENLKALGNPEGRPYCSRFVRMTSTSRGATWTWMPGISMR